MSRKLILEGRGELAGGISVDGLELRAGESLAVTGDGVAHLVKGFLTGPGNALLVLGARADTLEARSVTAVVPFEFQPSPALSCLEHLVAALRLSKKRHKPREGFRETLAGVGLAGYEQLVAEELGADQRYLLGLAIAMVRPVSLLVIAVRNSGLLTEWTKAQLRIAKEEGAAVLYIAEDRIDLAVDRSARLAGKHLELKG
jgi:hypothetical protein